MQNQLVFFGVIMSQQREDQGDLAAAASASHDSPSTSAETALQAIELSLPEKNIRGLVASYLMDDGIFPLFAKGVPRFFPAWISILELLLAVTQGSAQTVVDILNRSPSILFSKGQIPSFGNTSAFQLILFYMDWDMLNQIKPWIYASKESLREAHKQCLVMQGGGADLVKTTKDPHTIDSFIELKQIIEGDATYPLLENGNGLVFCTTTRQFSYVDLEAKTVALITPKVSNADQDLFTKFKSSLNAMDDNSSRRSSNDEHDLITRTMGCVLKRQGIKYIQEGIVYKDTKFAAISIINAYRTYTRLYNADPVATPWPEVQVAWLTIGKTLRGNTHILQRMCELNKPFFPLPSTASLINEPFNRSLSFHGFPTDFPSLQTHLPGVGLGFDFSLCKGGSPIAIGSKADGRDMMRWQRDGVDLAAILQIVNVGKASVANLMHDLEETLAASSNPCHGAAARPFS